MRQGKDLPRSKYALPTFHIKSNSFPFCVWEAREVNKMAGDGKVEEARGRVEQASLLSGLPRESGQLDRFLLSGISSPTWEPRSHTPWQL